MFIALCMQTDINAVTGDVSWDDYRVHSIICGVNICAFSILVVITFLKTVHGCDQRPLHIH